MITGSDSLRLKQGDIGCDNFNIKHTSCQSLLSILHEKNMIIEKLQKQLHFQKLQLKYYLGKSFTSPKISELSRTCKTYISEENLPVQLAMSRFYRQAGMKSKIINLYDKMINMEGRVNTILHIQECVLRKIVTKICEMAKCDGLDMKIHLTKIVADMDYMELFNNLLNANTGLKKHLDIFRICCDRLMVIEEERNMIVEQVYTLPVEQRTNCNYLIGIQLEKVQLQNKMTNILKDQEVLRKRIEELNIAEDQLRNLQEEYKTAYRTNTAHVTLMLKKVNNEALMLITKSNEQKEKYTQEIIDLKKENLKISKVLEHVKNSLHNREIDKETLKLETVYSAGLYKVLDKEISQAIQESEFSRSSVLEQKINECEDLEILLADTRHAKLLLETKLEQMKTEFEQARLKYERDVHYVEQERDSYKAQVDDLQAIRSAYAQLIESRVDTTALQSKCSNQSGKLDELERENEKLTTELFKYHEVVNEQKTKIAELTELLIKESKKQASDSLQSDTSTRSTIENYIENKPEREPSCNKCREKSESEKTEIPKEIEKSPNHLRVLGDNLHLEKIVSGIIDYDDPDPSNVDTSNTKSKIEETTVSDIPGVKFPVNEMFQNTNDKNEDNYATSFEIKSSHRNGKQDSIKAVLEGRDKIEGTLKIGDTSMLSLKVNCGAPNKIMRKPVEEPIKKEVIDEFELMRDCSFETVAYTVPPYKPDYFQEIPSHTVKEECCFYSRKRESKPVCITFKNENQYRTTDFSSSTDAYDSSEMECFAKSMEVNDVKYKLKALADKLNADMRSSSRKYVFNEKVKSMSKLN